MAQRPGEKKVEKLAIQVMRHRRAKKAQGKPESIEDKALYRRVRHIVGDE